MADSAHLEKMGRELKCPICLSLLNTSVSLSCNHVFCNSCILKSMKSDSHCPVCKVPYRRREIRFAPHMDNLVSIYKNMEVASGINIFVSQTAKKSGETREYEEEQNQVHDTINSNRSETGGNTNGKRKRQSINRKGLKESEKFNSENSDPQSLVKPSFPSKKRVHVPQDLLSETPMRPGKCEEGSDKHLENRQKDYSIHLKEKAAFNEKGEPVFSPFFWLREEEDNDFVESLNSQQTVDHVSDSPQNVPAFSDIKDSDDESPTKRTHTVKVANVFDSEMFEWTQRACSPELCLTPVRSQVDYHDGFDGIQEKKCKANSENLTASDVKEKKENGTTDTQELTTQKFKNKIAQNRRKKFNKRGNRSNGKASRKYDTVLPDETHGVVPSDLSKIAEGCKIVEGLTEGAMFPVDTSSKAPNLLKKLHNRNKRTRFDATDGNDEIEDAPAESVEANIQSQGNENVHKELASLSEKNSKDGRNVNLRCSSSIDNLKYQRNSCKSSKRQEDDTAAAEVHHEVPINQNQVKENAKIQLSLFASREADDTGTSDFEKTSRSSKKMNIQIQRNVSTELRKQMRSKLSTSYNANKGLVNDEFTGSSKPTIEKTQATELHKDHEIITNNNSRTKKALSISGKRILQKCESIPTQIQCAFCHSSINSEVSGEMMHYFKGKPVAADYNGGSNIIHSHRNCTEWAPNVYFEDDNVINLEAELARSRRIRCCCCGSKGAALGCYEKSCHKSFHVPCAKLVPQCRWDTENFVILCPLHPSLKLPKEISESPGKSRKKPIARGPQAEVRQNGATGSWLCKGSDKKCVLCYSGLSTEEKGIVSKFKRVAGVSLSNNFGPNVTHIISSTDENGACRRTLKFLMGILEGRWILKIDWVKACLNASEFVAEEQFEISVDIHGIRDGPRLGRLRLLNKQSKLYNGLKFYFVGEYTPSYKGYLQDLVVAAGGTVLRRKPISGGQSGLSYGSSASTTFIIYNAQPPECGSGKKTIHSSMHDVAEALANSIGANVASHSWVLDSIAACKLQEL